MRRLAHLVPLMALVVLPFALHWKLFAFDSEDRKIFRGDFLNQHFVWKSYALSRVASGELPLWNPHVQGGIALHANPQVAIFYPPTYLLLPFLVDGHVNYIALEAYQLLHQVIAGLGMWLLMRSFGVSNLGAFFAALVYTFTGFFTTPGHHAIVLTASWIPWTLHAVKKAMLGTSTVSIGVAAITLAGMVLAGAPASRLLRNRARGYFRARHRWLQKNVDAIRSRGGIGRGHQRGPTSPDVSARR